MAPFPESESMTIKRLEVALRKKDMHLLKDGAYKLHEKFHTGHRFEFTPELEQILNYVKDNDIPDEIKEILCPTIEEILSQDSYGNSPDSRLQTPQNPSNTPGEITLREEDIKLQGQAYEDYLASRGQNTSHQKEADKQPRKETITLRQEARQGDVLVFYDDNSRDISHNEIKNYRNKLNNLFSMQNHDGDYNLLRDIATLNNIVDTKVFDIDKVIAMLKTSKSNVSFVTTSQSQELTKILCNMGIDFSIPYVKNSADENTKFNFIPMLGLSNIYVCSHCNSRSLKTDFSTKTLSVQCPNCDSAAFPDLYAINSYNPDCNPIFWHRAMKAFIKSKIWIIVNPPLDENKEIIFDFIKTASECSTPEKIYIYTKENDKKEFYTNLFAKTLPNTQLYKDFFNIEELCANYIREQITDKINEKY